MGHRVAPMTWVGTAVGYELTLDEGVIVARNAKQRVLKSVPAKAKKTPEWERLDALSTVLQRHEAEIAQRVQAWVLQSLPVPTVLLREVWADPSWRAQLTDLVVTDGERSGFLRDIGADGLRVVDVDGETVELTAQAVRIPHPVLLEDLDDLRELAAELGVEQRFDQLFREVHRRPEGIDPDARSVHDYVGEYERRSHVASRATAAGFVVRGSYAQVAVVEDERSVVAQMWIGEAYYEETTIDELGWVSEGRMLRLGEVGPVAWSEGVRMAAHLYAGRVVKEEQE